MAACLAWRSVKKYKSVAFVVVSSSSSVTVLYKQLIDPFELEGNDQYSWLVSGVTFRSDVFSTGIWSWLPMDCLNISDVVATLFGRISCWTISEWVAGIT